MNITDLYIARLREFSNIRITDGVIHQILRCLLDYIAVVHAGAKEVGCQMEPFLDFGGKDVCTIFGSNRHTDIYTAVLMNGFASHAMELDDGHRFGMLHLEATVITAMIAVAQKEKFTFLQFIKGILIGYEATVRLATSIQPEHKQRGFHATGTCGSIGIACGVGFALDLNDDQIKGAVSAAATSAAGLLEVVSDDSQLKPHNVANAAMSGITAALIGKCGYKCPNDILGGKRGFFNAFAADFNLEKLMGGIGETFAIHQIYVKPYAACRHCHAPVECALNLIKEYSIEAGAIIDIEVQTYKLAIFGHDETEVTGSSAAKMSTPYSVAASIILGTCGVEAFCPETLLRTDIGNLAKKVRVVENQELTAACPEKRGAIVTIYLSDGNSFVNEVTYPLGEPENKISDSRLEQKYESLMTYAGINKEDRDNMKEIIWNLKERYSEFMEI